jgi:RNA polymerase sigma-70 factor (ECF subfamily)
LGWEAIEAMLEETGGIARRSTELVALARGGDAAAYDRLFAVAADKVLFFIRMHLRSPLREEMDPLDVLQETYLEAHRSFVRFDHRGTGSFSRWLCRIAAHVLAGLADRAGASKRRPPGRRRSISRVLDTVVESGVDPGEIAARREEIERLEQAMAALDGDERRALLLRYFQEETIEAMAEILEMSPTAVRRLLGRATARLGERLEEGKR